MDRLTDRFGVVLLLIVITYAVAVTVDESRTFGIVLLLQYLTLWTVFRITETRKAQWLATLGGIFVVVLILADYLLRDAPGHSPLTPLVVLIGLVLYLLAPAAILRHLMSRPRIDVHALLGTIAAYLLIGMLFAFIFHAVALYETSVPFFGEESLSTLPNFLFFSFMTMTTVGYGDLVPATNPGQSFAVLEAIIGQLFLVTAVAKIVTAWQLPGKAGV